MAFQKAIFVAAFQLKQSWPIADWSYVAKRKKRATISSSESISVLQSKYSISSSQP
jgi:hypothetical protein